MEDCGDHQRGGGKLRTEPNLESTTRSFTLSALQTSITIDDITFVVDTGKVKETQYDPDSGLTKLVEQWVTKAAAKQRRGRAGRTKPGVCYKLFTRRQEKKMAAFPKPEILRVPLESISLSVKSAREHEDVKVRVCSLFCFKSGTFII